MKRAVQHPTTSFRVQLYEQIQDAQAYFDPAAVHILQVKTAIGSLQVEGQTYPTGSNRLFLLPPSVRYLIRRDVPAAPTSIVLLSLNLPLLKASLLKTPELISLRRFLENLKQGMYLPVKAKEPISLALRDLNQESNLLQLAAVVRLLDLIEQDPDKTWIGSRKPNSTYAGSYFLPNRLEPIMDYIQSNLKKPISLEQVSRKACMSKSSFIRYFKKYTNTTFTNYLNELRVIRASRLLLETDFSVYRISLEAGFNSLSNFNRHFKKVMNQTPTEYRKRLQLAFHRDSAS